MASHFNSQMWVLSLQRMLTRRDQLLTGPWELGEVLTWSGSWPAPGRFECPLSSPQNF